MLLLFVIIHYCHFLILNGGFCEAESRLFRVNEKLPWDPVATTGCALGLAGPSAFRFTPPIIRLGILLRQAYRINMRCCFSREANSAEE